MAAQFFDFLVGEFDFCLLAKSVYSEESISVESVVLFRAGIDERVFLCELVQKIVGHER